MVAKVCVSVLIEPTLSTLIYDEVSSSRSTLQNTLERD